MATSSLRLDGSPSVGPDAADGEPRRLPTYALSHGGGPWPWIKHDFIGDWGPLERSLQAIPGELPAAPRAILVVSGHWTAPAFTVQTHPRPPMLYDYYGFPEHTYRVSYPSPGDPELAEQVVDLLSDAGLPVGRDARRGYDHGTFVPLTVAWPDADVPVVQLSLQQRFDAVEHLAAGRALAPLRDESVLVLGSGVPTFHDLSKLGPPSSLPSTEFGRWLTAAMVENVGTARSRLLEAWDRAPSARQAHPDADHFLPLLVAVGASEDEPAAVHYHEDRFMGWTASTAYRIGTPTAPQQRPR